MITNMITDIEYNTLTPCLQKALEYITLAAAGGIIGNRADVWFMSLFYHQRQRLVDWLSIWKPQIQDLENLIKDEKLRAIFSSIIYEVCNEIDDLKFLIWPDITDSIIRKQDIKINKKQYFVSLFKRLDSFSLQYLACLSVDSGIDYFHIFNESGKEPDMDSRKHIFFLGQLQCSTTGLTIMTGNPVIMQLTPLGKEFVDFISDTSKEKLKYSMT